MNIKNSWPVSLNDFTEAELKKKIFDHIWPYEKLKIDVEELDKLNLPAAKIASFLLKCQLVEHELKNLIVFLDEVTIQSTKGLPFTKIRSDEKIKKLQYELGLGQLKNELKEFRNPDLKKIIDKIETFKKARDKFTHRLFSQNNDISDLAKESVFQQNNAVECLELIKDTHNKILRDYANYRIAILAKSNEYNS